MQDEPGHENEAAREGDAAPIPSEPAEPDSDFVVLEPPAPPAEMPDDLSAIAQVLEQPTAEIMGLSAAARAAAEAGEPVTAASAEAPEAEPAALLPEVAAEPEPAEPGEPTAEHAAPAAAFDEIAPGTVASEDAEAPASEGEAEAEEAGPESAEGEQPAEAAEGAETAAETEPAPETETEAAAAAAGEEVEGWEAEPEALAETGPITKVSWWPFIGYIVVWLAGATYVVYQLKEVPVGRGIYETQLYSYSLLAGLSLLAAGPVLLLVVWIASFVGRKPRKIGLMFLSALIKGATATLVGALIWAGALFIIDYLRYGKVF